MKTRFKFLNVLTKMKFTAVLVILLQWGEIIIFVLQIIANQTQAVILIILIHHIMNRWIVLTEVTAHIASKFLKLNIIK